MPIDDLIPLPDDDADVRLARRLGEGAGLSGVDHFERLLSDYRNQARSESLPAGLSERLWQRLVPNRTQVARPLRLIPTWARWATAAAATIIVAIVYWQAREHEPTLVSSSSAEIVSVALEDGSKITLRPHSALYRAGKNRYVLEGEAFFDVFHDPDRVFQVETNLGRIRVLGTRFDVSTWGDETVVFLERGRVAFEHLATGAADTLAPGDELVASTAEVIVERPQNASAGALDWMNESLVFGSRPLKRIIAEMEHHFGITVIVPDSLETETLSGQIYLSGPEQSLRDLGTALGMHFDEIRPNVFRLAAR